MGRFELVPITLSVIVMLCVSFSSWVGVGEGASTPCDQTPYPQLCTQILHTNPSMASSTNPPLQRQISAMAAYALSLTNVSYQAARSSSPSSSSSSLDDCIDLLRNSMDQLSLVITRCAALVDVGTESESLRRRHIMDIQVALSQAFTMQDTCSGGLGQAPDSSDSKSSTMTLIVKRSIEIGQVEDVALSLADTLRQTAP